MRNTVLALTLFVASLLAHQPRIDSISPSSGPIAVGTTITIRCATISIGRSSGSAYGESHYVPPRLGRRAVHD